MNIDDFDKPEHAKFVTEYFKKNMNGTRAYLAVYGEELDYYGAAASASRLLKNVKVSAAIKRHLRDNIMSPDEILSRLAEMGRGEHAEYLKEDGTLDIKRMVEDGKAYLIKGIRDTKYGRHYDFPDQKSALELHGKYWAMWKDKIEVESRLETETLQLLKNGDITPEQAIEILGDNDRIRELIKSAS